MKNIHFSFIILTFNEEMHLSRLLNSLQALNTSIFVLDSGSTDLTLNICKAYNIKVLFNKFKNHPQQWDRALNAFQIKTPWVICLDADQILSHELFIKLKNFSDQDYTHINGIYFNRKNYFKGKWIKHGGYYPKYLLKMFRYGVGYSDLNETMDHRFQVPSDTLIWKDGYLIEENLKENNISFWIEKHNRYSDLLAEEEIERQNYKTTAPHSNPAFWGSPNQRIAWQKNIWWKLPMYLRPVLYFLYRMIFQLGVLDGKRGIVFHFLQGFWFRLIVDIKIEERLKSLPQRNASFLSNKAFQFLCTFISLFSVFYLINLTVIGLTHPNGYYFDFLNKHLNYVKSLRHLLINSSGFLLKIFGYTINITEFGLKVKDHAGFKIVYSCLGLTTSSFFSAFVISYPKSSCSRIIFLVSGLIGIQFLNVTRLTLIAIFYKPQLYFLGIDHHHIFNTITYTIICLSIYLWINQHTKLKI